MVSANTHFEEWWFKTFFYSTAKAAYISIPINRPTSFRSWFFVCLLFLLESAENFSSFSFSVAAAISKRLSSILYRTKRFSRTSMKLPLLLASQKEKGGRHLRMCF
jgi:hypothetical protein